MNNNKLEILVTAKDAASDVIAGVGKNLHGIGDSAMRGSQAAAAGLAVAGAAAIAFGKTSVDAYFGAAEASSKLATNLLNVKGNTQANVDSLETLASSLQSVGVIEDDVIKAGMSQLATFNLQGSSIATLTPKIADMVAQMKGHNATADDMVGINNLVGKVMTGNVGALSRYGVTLSDASAEIIKNGTESQKAAEIAKVLGENYGEVNKALARTPQGMFTQLKNNLGDLQEGVGELIVSAFMPLMGVFSDWMAKVNEAGGFVDYFNKMISENMDKVKMLAGALIAVLVPAIWGVLAPILPVVAGMAGLMAIGALLAPHIDNLAQKFGGWGKIMDTVKGIASGVWESLKLLVTGDFSGGIFGAEEDSQLVDWLFKVREAAIALINNGLNLLKQAWAGLQMAIAFLMPSFMSLWSTIQNELLPALVNLWNFIQPVIIPTLQVLGAIIGGVLVAAIWVAVNVLRIIIGVVSWFINVLIDVVSKIIWFANMIVQYINFVLNIWRAVFNAIYAVVTWLVNAAIAYFQFWVNMISAIINGVIGIFRNVFNAAWNAVTGIWNGIGGFFSGIVGRIGGVLGGVTNAITAPFQAAFNFVKELPGRMVGAIGNVGNLLRDKLGGIDIPGPLGLVRDVIPGFATGGFTGRGGKYDVAGLVHKGEYVVPKEQVNQSTGLPYGAGGGGFKIEIHGNVINETPEAARAWWGEMNRMGELAEQGVAI